MIKLKTKFQDEHFSLGEVVDVYIVTMPAGRIRAQAIAKNDGVHTFFYEKLETFLNDWEDAPEEPEGWWFICQKDNAYEPHATNSTLRDLDADREIGNYFSTKEEAEKAVEKLKAWKRLKDKGFKFEGWDNTARPTTHNFYLFAAIEDLEDINKDLDLLFGGEE